MIKKANHKIRSLSLILTLTLLPLIGCSVNKEVIPKNQSEAGSFHIAVLSVAEWDKYRDDLMPKFNIDSQKALELVMPTTGTWEDKTIDSMSGGLRIALPTGEKSGTESKNTSTENSKDNGKIIEASIPKTLTENQLAVDPMLRYLSATALYQEVKLLNRYLEDSTCESDFIPYIVRLQISIMPHLRNLPYDSYINLSFFTSETKLQKNARNINNTPLVLPLLVTDNLENILHMKSSDKLRQIAAYLALAYQGVGLGAEFQKKYENIQNILGKDFNSILTVGRVSDNTMRARIGALKQIDSGYAMIPRTHNITFLLLAHKNAKYVEISSKATMVNVKDGKELPGRSGLNLLFDELIDAYVESKQIKECHLDDFAAKADIKELMMNVQIAHNNCSNKEDLQKCLQDHGWNKNLYKLLQEMSDDIEANDWREFNKLARCLTPYPDQLWTDFVSKVYAGTQWDVTRFSLPEKKAQELYDQVAVLQDDGVNTSTILLRGKNLNVSELDPTLHIQKNNTSPYLLAPQNIEILSHGTVAKLAFPSLKIWGLGDAGNYILKLQTPSKPLDVIYLIKPAPPKRLGYKVTVPASIITADNSGKGTLQLIINKDNENPAEKIFLEIMGAQIEKIVSTPDKIIGKQGETQWFVSKNGILNLSLANLNDNAEVIINFYNEKKEKHEQIVRPVSKR
ncbi:MAG: hypothetical protein CVU71_09105 [Deltaproteobacteria bacterium HGW-Deltaproteobacteria-6]|nr:MAG: hypothetical protein CVU71_09105 [Deltaproteobacteria bacterium HGW-Deltaproteobacteria-6]